MRAQGRVMTIGELVLDEIVVEHDGGQLPAGRWSAELYVTGEIKAAELKKDARELLGL